MKKVVIGMSGGVDSSVAAILLQKQGYEVIGVTFIFTDNFDVSEAQEVCKKLNIKHYIKDYRKEFKEEIINKFLDDYKSGLTPNPCVLCNKKIKIKYLIDAMKEFNADFIATGHYARVIDGKLYKSENINKDQTYFLSQLSKEEISKLIFPLDNMDKGEVRTIASEYGLTNASKKDSYDVCFITSSFKEYMQNYLKPNKGSIINIKTNEEIGIHDGLMYYTIGQRKGLNLGGNKDRLFVINKDLDNNILYVASDSDGYLYSSEAEIENVNWISDERPEVCNAKFRYRQTEQPVNIKYLENGNIILNYSNEVKSVTPGQVCALYKDDECLGGGIIKSFKNNNI